MTNQVCNFIEYEGKQYCLMGYTGGKLPSAADYGMQFSGVSTANHRGYRMIYAIQHDTLVVKRIELEGNEIAPITHNFVKTVDEAHGVFYDVGQPIIPLTGYLLFSSIYDVHDLYGLTQTNDIALYEAEIQAGKLIAVHEISDFVRERILKSGNERFSIYRGETAAEQLASIECFWYETAQILPRRYDTLYTIVWYMDYPRWIADLKSKL